VMREFMEIKQKGTLQLPAEELARIDAYFAPPKFEALPDEMPQGGKDFENWLKTNVHPHRAPGYAIATISLKPIGGVPGDCSAEQLDALAELLDTYGMDEIRVSHEQNLVLPHVKKRDLPAIFAKLSELGLATPNAGLITDIIACPGLDYCDLANARSIPVAQSIAKRFADISCRELDSPTSERLRQQAERRFLDITLTCIRIGRLQIIRLFVLLGPRGAHEEDGK